MGLYSVLLYSGTIFAFLTISNGNAINKKSIKQSMNNTIDVDNVCSDQECKRTVNKILQSMNATADPCNDFYAYACGNFKYSNEDVPSVYDDVLSCIKEDVLPSDPKTFKLAKSYYQSCVNTAASENLGLEPLQKVLSELGGWPAISPNWKEENFDWLKTITKVENTGLSSKFWISFHVDNDLSDRTKQMIMLGSDPPLYRDRLLEGMESKYVKAYFDYMVDMAKLLGDEIDENRTRSELKEALEFEIKLNNITLEPEHKYDLAYTHNPITIREMSSRYMNFSWLEYINIMLDGHAQVGENEMINVHDTKYLKNFESVLTNTSKRAQANYIIWKIVERSVPYLNEATMKIQSKFISNSIGFELELNRTSECGLTVSSDLSIATNAMYVKKYFTGMPRDKIYEMADNVRKQLYKSIEKSDWMDATSQKLTLNKINATDIIVGYPTELADNAKLEGYYSDLEDLDPEEYFQNAIKIEKLKKTITLKRLRKPYEGKDWTQLAELDLTSNYAYDYTNNIIYISAAYLRNIFNKSLSESITYAQFTSDIGRELMKVIDEKGHKFDINGNSKSIWTNKTETKYRKQIECLKDLYDGFKDEITGVKIDGGRTLQNNFADVSGIKHAFRAFSDKIQSNSIRKESNFTSNIKKLFWITAANAECRVVGQLWYDQITSRPEYSFPPYNVNGPFQNLKEFSQTFKCPLGSKMNPKKKCFSM